jgi:hypothetical protein
VRGEEMGVKNFVGNNRDFLHGKTRAAWGKK